MWGTSRINFRTSFVFNLYKITGYLLQLRFDICHIKCKCSECRNEQRTVKGISLAEG